MIDILLATYNGEKYLKQQLDSILAQNVDCWHLYIKDDCSSDSTLSIAKSYESKYPDKITVINCDVASGSAKANFLSLLKYSSSRYIMFCDQDDVWLPDKISTTLKAMQENESDSDLPILIHTDLTVVDDRLNTLHSSFIKFQGLNSEANTLNRLLVQNNVTGCTVMINRTLLNFAADIDPDKILMHDWWFGLIASAFGKIVFIDKPTILYRQHSNNQLGAVNNRSIKGSLKIVLARLNTKKRISATFSQAQYFFDKYVSLLNDSNQKLLKTFLVIQTKPKFKRFFYLLKHKFLKQNLLTAIGQLIFC
ncbi:MAG: glycosyltransferase family 2 protein [bacterium]|nr:glycosyltransferase family 2 protein [bacterium]